MATMTRRERLRAIYEGRTPDRSAIKVWGAQPDQICHPAVFEKVRDLACAKTEILATLPFVSFYRIYCGQNEKTHVEVRDVPISSPNWVDEVAIYHTPLGDLREVNYKSTCHKPGYEKEYPLKEPNDIKKLLSMPYNPYPPNVEGFRAAEARIGDAGIVQYHLDNPLCALQRIIGSENFALWSYEADDLYLEALQLWAGRLRDQIKLALAAGIKGPFGWVGPELCIPPLMPPSAFERYVFEIDKPMVDLIHNGGGHVWLHCHGKMRPVLQRFVDMGVDVLNPLEPPPMGDIELDEAFAIVGDRMALEGNIETHDMMTASREVIRHKLHANLDAGKRRRHILCPSAGYYENPEPSEHEIDNWIFFIEEGLRYAEEISRS